MSVFPSLNRIHDKYKVAADRVREQNPGLYDAMARQIAIFLEHNAVTQLMELALDHGFDVQWFEKRKTVAKKESLKRLADEIHEIQARQSQCYDGESTPESHRSRKLARLLEMEIASAKSQQSLLQLGWSAPSSAAGLSSEISKCVFLDLLVEI